MTKRAAGSTVLGHAWKQPNLDRPAFYHDLQCLSGYGDRLADLWAALTVARLHDPDGLVAVRWEKGNKFLGFVGTYATELFTVAGCTFVDRSPRGARRVEKRFSHTELNDRSMIRLRSGRRQIVLRSGMIWGNSSPDRLHGDRGFYELDGEIGLSTVVDTYRAIARSTEPAPAVIEGIPDDIGERVGVHVRLQDKLVADEAPYDMSGTTWASIEAQGNLRIERCIARGERLFVCSDDPSYKATLLQRIRSMGGDGVGTEPPGARSRQPGHGALVDFFALARCARIIQMTKYSTFSIAAALVGGIPLVNLDPAESRVGNRLDIWNSALPQLWH